MTNERKVLDVNKTLMELADEGWTLKELIDELKGKVPKLNFKEKVKESTKERITRVMMEIGVPVGFLGFEYLESAIEVAYENPKAIQNVSRDIFPIVAQKYDVVPERIVRNIYYTIQRTWESGNLEAFRKYFGNRTLEEERRPTIKQFIAVIANVL